MRHPPCSSHAPSPAPSRLFGGVAVPAVAAEERNSQVQLGVWELYFGLPGDQEVTRGWDSRCSEPGATATAADEGGNGGRGSGSSVRA